MDIIARGITAGTLGTLMMDTLNHLFSRAGIILKIEVGMIGRMAAGWTQVRFRYRYPGEMQPVANEKLCGVITHYGPNIFTFFHRKRLAALMKNAGFAIEEANLIGNRSKAVFAIGIKE